MSTHTLKAASKTPARGFFKKWSSKLSAMTAIASLSALVMGDILVAPPADAGVDTTSIESISAGSQNTGGTENSADTGIDGADSDSFSTSDLLSFSLPGILGVDSVEADARTVWDFARPGGGGGGGMNWSATWQTAYRDGNSSAWRVLAARRASANGDSYVTDAELRSTAIQYGGVPGRTMDQCRQSNRADSWIWYTTIRNAGNIQRSYPSVRADYINRSNLGTSPRSPLRTNFRTPFGSFNTSSRGATTDEWNAFLDHRQNGRTGRADWNTGGVAIICSTPEVEEAANGPKVSRGTASYRITRDFQNTETVSRRCDNAFATIDQTPGLAASTNSQRSTPVVATSTQNTLACGTLYNRVNRGDLDGNSRSSVISAINSASNDSLTNATAAVSQNNRRALAEGNVLNNTLRTRDVTINWSQRSTATRTATTYCEYWYEETRSGGIDRVIEVNCNRNGTPRTSGPSGSNSNVESGSRCSYGDWVGGTNARNNALNRYLGSNSCPQIGVNVNSQNHSRWETNRVTRDRSNVSGSLHAFSTHTFYQTLGVTCNVRDFDNAVSAASGATAERANSSSTPNDKRFSAVAYSGKRTGSAAATGNANRDWGRSGHSNNSLARTGTLNFYTKECDFDVGTGSNRVSPNSGHLHASNPTSEQAFGTVARATSMNSRPGGSSSDNLFGPGSSTSNGARNEVTFTRDNTGETIELQVASPNPSRSSSIVRVNNNGVPVRTMVTRWSEGTPGIDRNSGQFGVTALRDNGSSLGDAFTGNDNMPTITNAQAPAAMSNDTVTIFNQGLSKFDVRANWPSEQDRPEILNVAWGYDVSLNTAMHRGIRPASSGRARYDFGSYSSPNNVTTSHYGRVQADFTGAHNYGNADHIYNNTGHGVRYVAPQQDDSVSWNAGTDNSNNLVINFIRSVSER